MGLESELDKGSIFWFELPGTKTVEGSKRTVLYIEDDVSISNLIKRTLQCRPDIEMFDATRGETGIDLAKEHPPDAILLDLGLPDIPGEEVLRRLQKDPATNHIPVLIISVGSNEKQVSNLLAAGARAYLTKPIDLPRFLDTLDASLPAPTGPSATKDTIATG